jgi:hypothetical protein
MNAVSSRSKYVVAGSVVLASMVYYFWRKNQNGAKDVPVENEELGVCEIMPSEYSFLYLPCIPTLTFYKGDLPPNHIADRLKAIMHANCWLAGRLVKKNSKVFITYPKQLSDDIVQKHYKEVTIDNAKLPKSKRFHETSSLEILLSHVKDLFVTRGNDCVNKPNEVLFKVIVIRVYDRVDSESDKEETKAKDGKSPLVVARTVLLFCMSHMLGDGYTYYSIYNMLDKRNEIRSLIPERKSALFMSKLEEIQGKAFKDFLVNPLLILRMISVLLFASKPKIQFFKIKKDEIIKIKKNLESSNHEKSDQEEGNKTSFLSTNDIVATWFFRQCQSTFGSLACNVRNRISGLGDDLAGNYLTFVSYSNDDFDNPWNMRKSLPRLSAHKEIGQSKVPSMLDLLPYKFAAVTNWSTFFQELHFNQEANPFLFHVPVLDNNESGFKDLLVIFSPTKDEIGLFILSRTLNEEKYWLNSANPFVSTFS